MMVKKWLLTITVVSLLSSPLLAVNWDAGAYPDEWWGTAANWTTDTLPPTTDQSQITLETNSPYKGPVIKGGDNWTITHLFVGLNNTTVPAKPYGKLDVTGGVLNLTGGDLRVGHQTGGDGIVNISGGTINAAAWVYFCNGASSRGQLNMTGGTFNANNGFLGGNGNDSIGTINISGTASLLVKNSTAGTLRLGSNGAAAGGKITMNVSGSALVETANLQLANTTKVGAEGIINLTGGTIACNSLTMGTAAGVTAKIDVAGGTLRINGDQRTNLQPHIDADRIVAYNNHPRATLNVVYLPSPINKTEVTATLPDLKQAYAPSPIGADVAYNGVTLSWTAGDGAVSHDVYLGDDFDAVTAANTGTAGIFLGNQPGTSKAVGDLELDKTYYWRIDEQDGVNPATKGEVWSFTVESYIEVDDMTAYDGGNPIGGTWVAGGGAAVSLDEVFYFWVYPKSLRLDYNNGSAPYLSTATRTFATDQDWTVSNVEALQLVFHGAAANSVEPVYVVIEDADGDSQTIVYSQTDDTIVQQSYRPWLYFDIDLTSLNANIDVTRIKKFTVGVGNPTTPAAGGTGTVWFDLIALYPPRCISAWAAGDTNGDCIIDMTDLMVLVGDWLKQDQVVAAVAPTSGLVAHYTFDETFGTDVADSSGNNYTAQTDSSSGWSTGKFGGCIVFDGSTVNYVDVPQATATTMFSAIDKEFTISLWLWGTEQTPYANSMMEATGSGLTRPVLSHCPWTDGTVYFDSGDTTDNRTSFLADENQFYGQWNHYAYVKNANEGWMRIYVNGELVAQTLNTATKGIAGVTRFTLGNRPGYTAPWKGKMDEFRLYSRALTQAEIVSLADKTSVNQPLVTPMEIVEDGIVNLKDAAEMFSNWLAEVLWP